MLLGLYSLTGSLWALCDVFKLLPLHSEAPKTTAATLRHVRHLQSTVVALRRERDELQEQQQVRLLLDWCMHAWCGLQGCVCVVVHLQELQGQATAATEKLAQRDALVSRLEAQLLQHTGQTLRQLDDADTSQAPATRHLASALSTADGVASSTSPAASSASHATGVVGSLSASSSSGAVSVVDILRGQRDRFRSKVLNLEQQGTQLRSDLTAARARVSKLTDDNVRLYEKVKYLESYTRRGGGGGGAGVAAGRHGAAALKSGRRVDVETGGTGSSARLRDDFDATYGRMYEDSVNPFTEFNKYVQFPGTSPSAAVCRCVLTHAVHGGCVVSQERETKTIQQPNLGREGNPLHVTLFLVKQVRSELHFLLCLDVAHACILDVVSLCSHQPCQVSLLSWVCSAQ